MLDKQVELQYSLTEEAIKKFDAPIKNLEHNELMLQNRISQLVNITDNAITIKDLFCAEDIFT